MKKLFILSLIALVALLSAGVSVASSGSISIATLNGTPYAGQEPALGNTMTFSTTVPKLTGGAYPMVAVSCYQDVNGDGTVDTSITGPDVVYTELDHPSATFTLGGYASIWTERGGGNAICRADLYSYQFKHGGEQTQILATTGDFPVTG